MDWPLDQIANRLNAITTAPGRFSGPQHDGMVGHHHQHPQSSDLLFAPVGAISLLVSGIEVMNTAYQRGWADPRKRHPHDHGARDRDVLQQFLTEVTVISGIGGARCSGGCGNRIDDIGVWHPDGLYDPSPITALPVALAFGCAVATGLVFGFAPAMKAARLNPVVALASE